MGEVPLYVLTGNEDVSRPVDACANFGALFSSGDTDEKTLTLTLNSKLRHPQHNPWSSSTEAPSDPCSAWSFNCACTMCSPGRSCSQVAWY